MSTAFYHLTFCPYRRLSVSARDLFLLLSGEAAFHKCAQRIYL